MSLGIDYPVISGGTIHNTIDPYAATGINQGAQNLPGSIYAAPLDFNKLITSGAGSQRFLRYVRYNPTVSVAIGTGPAPVYFKDNTFQTVTPTLSEALGASPNAFAGFLVYNTTQTPSATAAQINGNFVFIHIGGYIANVLAPAGTAVGDAIIGAAGSFQSARVAAGTAPGYRVGAYALTAIANGVADYNVPLIN